MSDAMRFARLWLACYLSVGQAAIVVWLIRYEITKAGRTVPTSWADIRRQCAREFVEGFTWCFAWPYVAWKAFNRPLAATEEGDTNG